MNPDLRVQIEKYIESLFVTPDPVLAQNISDAQVLSQIAVLNQDYQKLNADVSKVPSAWTKSTSSACSE